MTDILKDLGARLDGLEKGLNESLAKRQDAANDQLRKELEEKIKAQQAMIEKLEATRADAARAAVPGVEYAKNGEENKFSLWRATQLAIGTHLPGEKEGQLWKAKSHGYEVEVFKTLQEQGVQKTMHIGTDSAGGVFVPSNVLFDSVIPELQSQAIVYQLGARRLDGLRGNLNWIVDEGGTAAYYIDTEAEESVTTSKNTFSTLSVRPHTMGADTALTRGMRMQSAVAMEAYVRSKFAEKFALKEDLTAFLGTGVDAEPRGLKNVPSLNTAVNFSGTTFTGASQTVTDKLRETVYAPLIANFASANGRPGWAARPEVGRKLANSKDADGKPLFSTPDNGVLTTLMGAPIRYTTQPTIAASNEFFVYSADWTKLIICHWGGMDFKVGYVASNQLKDVLNVTAFMDHDVIVEQGKAFVFASNFSTT